MSPQSCSENSSDPQEPINPPLYPPPAAPAPAAAKVRIQPSDIPAWANAFSGALGGAVANLLVFPLDLVTTRLQVQEKVLKAQRERLSKIDTTKPEGNDPPGAPHLSAESPQVDEARLYRGIVDAAVRIYRDEGLLAFYDGAVQDTWSTMLSAFFYFYAYDILRNARLNQVARRTKSGRPPSTLGIAEELLIGSLAGVFCKFFTAPLNNIVTRQQTAALVNQTAGGESSSDADPKQKGKSIKAGGVAHKLLEKTKRTHSGASAIQIAHEIYAERGFLGFWSGFGATILLSVNPSLTYYFFQLIKVIMIRGGKGATLSERRADRARRRENPTKVQLFFFSASAKTVASLITYPLILVKSQMQVKTSNAGSSQQNAKRPSMAATFTEIVKTNGVGHLYQGARAQILKGFFSQGITMLTKDQIARFIIYFYFVLARLRK